VVLGDESRGWGSRGSIAAAIPSSNRDISQNAIFPKGFLLFLNGWIESGYQCRKLEIRDFLAVAESAGLGGRKGIEFNRDAEAQAAGVAAQHSAEGIPAAEQAGGGEGDAQVFALVHGTIADGREAAQR
jgi:hypothetical protein